MEKQTTSRFEVLYIDNCGDLCYVTAATLKYAKEQASRVESRGLVVIGIEEVRKVMHEWGTETSDMNTVIK